MNVTSWYMMLAALAAGVVLSVTVSQRMSRPLPKYRKIAERTTVRTTETRTERAQAPKAATQAAAQAVEAPSAMSSAGWDELWKKSLFKDDRTEDVPSTESTTQETAGPELAFVPNPDFEVVGFACVGEGEEASPVVIIAQVKGLTLKRFSTSPNRANNNRNQQNNNRFQQNNNRFQQNNNRNQQNNNRFQQNVGNNAPWQNRGQFPGRNMGGQNQQAASGQTAQPEDRRVTRNIYHVGDSVGTTGYVVRKIIPGEYKVVMERAGQELVLMMDVRNTGASIRRQNTQNEELAQRQKRVEEEKQIQAQRQKEAQQAAQKARQAQQQRQNQQRYQAFQRQYQENQRLVRQQAQAQQQTSQVMSNILQNMVRQQSNQNQPRTNITNGRVNQLNRGK